MIIRRKIKKVRKIRLKSNPRRLSRIRETRNSKIKEF